MQLKIKLMNWSAGRPVAILSKKRAEKMNVNVDDRVLILKNNSAKIIAVLDIASKMLGDNEIAVSLEVAKILKMKKGLVEVSPAVKPKSLEFISKKLACKKLEKEEIDKIIGDIVNNALTEPEIAYFVSAVYKCGMSFDEIVYLTKAIVAHGKKLKLKGKIIDKHSIGGIPGNRTTPIIVSICSSAGLKMPKTSSRAITTASGTADTIETIAKVDFSILELKKIIRKTDACLVWGGSLNLAPADDKLIQIERLLNLDPEAQLLASIMAKKIAVNAKYVLIDIPFGKTAKVTKSQAKNLEKKFIKLGKEFNIKIKCILTDGSKPIGRGIGPALEILDILSVLKQEKNRPLDLEKKSVILSGLLFELTGKAEKGKGKELAYKILKSGEAFKKFKEIIKAQKGNINNVDVKKFRFRKDILAEKNLKIKEFDNKKINLLARIAGCPSDKYAGLYLWKTTEDKVKKGEKILTIYAESKNKLKEAFNFYKNNKPIKFA